ncbi:MAG: hypothetical protein KF795_33430, partial [Labilithrix sp.]|nr:hypothetical protein [Labilithrix sp.]
ASGGVGLGAKLLVAVALVGGTAATGAVVLQRDPSHASATSAAGAGERTVVNSSTAAPLATPAPPPLATPTAAPLAPSDVVVQDHVETTAALAPPPPAAPAQAVAPALPVTRPTATGRSEEAPSGATQAIAAKPPAPSMPLDAKTGAAPRGRPETPEPPIAPVATSDSVAEEAALLRAAHAALARGDGPSALARLDEHAARFPQGALGEERRAARVFALCASGRAAEARAAATTFAATSPRSPLAAQVRRSCATSAVAPPADGGR